MVHRYSGEVLLRPKTCRVAVADTAAENLRRIAWHSRGVAMELSVPWLVQEEHALRVQLSSPAAHLESLAPVPSENSAGALARAMLLVQNQSIAAPLVGGAYRFATAATRGSAAPAGAALSHLHAHTASDASSSKKSVTPPPGGAPQERTTFYEDRTAFYRLTRLRALPRLWLSQVLACCHARPHDVSSR